MPYAYIPDRTTGTRPRRRPAARAAEARQVQSDQTPGEAAASARRNVRPYLLKKFRKRESEELRAVPAEAFQRLREGIIKLSSNKGRKVSIPAKPDSEFFKAVTDLFDDEVRDLAIVEEDSRLFLEGEYSDMDNIYCVNILETEGLDHIQDPDLKSIAFDFVTLFIKSNNLTSYDDTVWSILVEEEGGDVDSWDIAEDEAESLKMSISMMNEELIPTNEFKKRVKDNFVIQEQLKEQIESFVPSNERDRKTVALLKDGFEWMGYIQDLLEEDDSSYGYASVEVCSYDRFMYVTADHGITTACWSLIDGAFGGDVYYHDLPVGLRIDGGGTVSYTVDLGGFTSFMEDLSNQLKAYIS